jgi:glycosyltransferase involved in cell wall biosynthesis
MASDDLDAGRSGSRLRLLMATPRFLPDLGGVEIHVDEVSRRLAARGVEVTVLTTDVTGTLPERDEASGVHVRRVRAWPAKRDYYFAPSVYTEVSRGDWDLVHVQSFHTLVAPLAMLAARRARIPYVVTFHAGGHSSRLREALRPLQLSLLRPLLARAARLIALAPHEVERYSKLLHLPETRFALVPNGSDLPAPSAAAAEDGDLIASVGRLERYKGHQRVIAALPELARRRPDVRLWIAGAGPYEAALREFAERLGVAERVDIRAIPAGERERLANWDDSATDLLELYRVVAGGESRLS